MRLGEESSTVSTFSVHSLTIFLGLRLLKRLRKRKSSRMYFSRVRNSLSVVLKIYANDELQQQLEKGAIRSL